MTTPLLLDASVWLAAVDRDDSFYGAARALLEAAGEDVPALAALDLTLYEVANVAVTRWRSPADAETLVRLVSLACADTLERVDGDLLRDAAPIASRHDLTVYDAAYVAASRRRSWTLVSADIRHLVAPGLAVAPDNVMSRG